MLIITLMICSRNYIMVPQMMMALGAMGGSIGTAIAVGIMSARRHRIH